jgi:hypothetical protein
METDLSAGKSGSYGSANCVPTLYIWLDDLSQDGLREIGYHRRGKSAFQTAVIGRLEKCKVIA